MNALKWKSLKSNLFLTILFLVIGAVLLVNGLPSVFIALSEPTALEDVDFSGDIDGLYVEGTIPFIYDWYCETVEGSRTVSREYVIDGGLEYYMGMRVMAKDMEAAEALMDASQTYMDGLDDGTAVDAAQYAIKGTIVPMPEDSIDLYHDYVGWDSMAAEEQEMFLHYYLDVNKAGSHDIIGASVLSAIGLVLLLVGILFIVWAMSGRCQKSIRRYIDDSANPELAREKVEGFLSDTPEVKGLRYNHEFICGMSNGTVAFGELSKLVWAYQHTTTHKRNFVTVGRTHCVVLGFADGSKQTAAVRKEADVQEHLERLSQLCPRAIIGYDAELERTFRKDLPGFLRLKYNNTSEPV